MNRYLANAWYMAGWIEELGESGFSREIRGERIFFYRTSQGLAALRDRCPHRFAPLSRGTRDGDAVVCGYHGLTFAPNGQCIRNPFSDRIPSGASVPAYAVVERDDIVWMWGGDPAQIDASLIPDFSFIPDTPMSRTVRGYVPMKANYEYGTDNLMDLSHIEFVHKGTFAGQGVIFAGNHAVIAENDTLHSNWWMPGIALPSFARGQVPPDAVVDHWLDMRWNAPASMRLNIGVCPHDAPRAAGFEAPQTHILTPANDHETHYFWSATRYHDLQSAEADAMTKSLLGAAFNDEDKPMIEAAYNNVRGKDFWSERPISLKVDAGGARARRQLQAMIDRETCGER